MAGGRFWALNNNCDSDVPTEMDIDVTDDAAAEDIKASKLYRSLQDESTGGSGKKASKKRGSPNNNAPGNNKASKTEATSSPKEPVKHLVRTETLKLGLQVRPYHRKSCGI